MEINIVKQHQEPKVYFDIYLVYTSWMFGDADGYEDAETIFPANEKNEMPGFLTVLEKALLAHPNGKGGSDGYDHVPGWEEYDLEYPGGGYDDCIPSLECYSVAYFDQKGERYDVEVVFTAEEQKAIKDEMKAVNKNYDR